MAQFSDNDINEAKRRVMDMKNKANRYAPPNINTPPSDNAFNFKEKESQAKSEASDNTDDRDNSFFIILALIMILSREGADNKLILALLYLLL